MQRSCTLRMLAVAVAVACGGDAAAVRIDPDGRGQALIYPYYTVSGADGAAFNTYLSVVNHAADTKALRVRFRESRHGQEVASFNLYLSPNDAWTGAVIPSSNGGARLITSDVSCTEPQMTQDHDFGVTIPGVPLGLSFGNGRYADDGAGAGLDRTREGYVEILEMATLVGTSAASVLHNSAGIPMACGRMASDLNPNHDAPTGGLSGTLTLIDVARGFDFTLRPEAIAELSTRPFFRTSADPYPGFDAAEIDPVSVVDHAGSTYRSAWPRGLDAVNAVLMRTALDMEYVLDAPSRSLTDLVVTFPTRPLGRPWVPAGTSASAVTPSSCGAGRDEASFHAMNREGRSHLLGGIVFTGSPLPPGLCRQANVLPVANGQPWTGGSLLVSPLGDATRDLLSIPSTFNHGWMRIAASSYSPGPLGPSMTSLPTSLRMNHATGAVSSGPHVFRGLPWLGFSARTFENGTLTCAAGSCQGNYGGAFAAIYHRDITAP